MKYIKQTLFLLVLVTGGTVYLLSNETNPKDKEIKTTSKDIEIKRDTEEIVDITLDIKDSIKNLKTTTINGEIINYGDNSSIEYIDTQVKNTKISNNYFVNGSQCSSSCGIAIQKWDAAKKYCNIRGSQLPSKSQISQSSKYDKNECSDCSYWTSTEALRPNGKSYPRKKVYMYLQSENDFSKVSSKSTYVATCIAD